MDKNIIKFESELKGRQKRDLESGLQKSATLKPNKKSLGSFKVNLWFYNKAINGRSTKFKRWILDRIGEEPVLLDTSAVQSSIDNMKSYLFDKGFFNASVNYEIHEIKRRAYVKYLIDTKKSYLLKSVEYVSKDEKILELINKDDKGVVKNAEAFDIDNLKDERKRITTLMKEEGYYYFNREYVYFDIDSSSNRQLKVKINIATPTDSTVHEKQKINDIYIYPDFSASVQKNKKGYDTLKTGEHQYFIYNELKIKPKVILNTLFLEHDKYYELSNHQKTINRLTALGTYKFVNVKLIPSEKENYLDVVIQLVLAKKQSPSIEFEANTNSNNLFGLAANTSYLNRNLLKGAERLLINFQTSVEFNTQNTNDSPINTLEFSVNSNLYFPKFLLPYKNKKNFKKYNPKTNIGLNYSYLRRIGFYTFTGINGSFGYEWNYNQKLKFLVKPLNFTYVRSRDVTPEFQALLDENPILEKSFDSQVIFGPEATLIYTDQKQNARDKYFYFKTTLSLSGNTLQGFNKIIRPNSNTAYSFFNLPYSQFSKLDVDLRRYQAITSNSTLVMRFLGGIGIPYGNSEVLPYLQQYFSGGTNNIRAWPVRTLGPGGFISSDPNDIQNQITDQTADIKLEFNAEQRFGIFEWVKGAVFADAGNIWTLKADTSRPNAHFTKQFYDQIAIGVGAGIRLDFTYFILRFDYAMKLRNPGRQDGKKWVWEHADFNNKTWRRENFNLNLAIGYPF